MGRGIPRRRVGFTLAMACLCLGGTDSPAMARRPAIPAWVTDPASLEALYPKNRYMTGVGVCPSPNNRDMMSRKKAENAAMSDIASVVEVQINDVVEQHDTDVERGGKLHSQSVRMQNTRRVVTGLLGGVEIKEAFFDSRSLNWYALAVLERGKAGRGVLEAVAQRLEGAQQALSACGRGPLSDLFILQPLRSTATDLDRLVVAVTMFAPAEKDSVKAKVDALSGDLAQRQAQLKGRTSVRIVIRAPEGARAPEGTAAAIARVLTARGISVAEKAEAAGGQLTVTFTTEASTQVGTMKIFKVAAGGRYELTEGGQKLLEGEVPVDEANAARSNTLQLSQQRSLGKAGEKLVESLAAALDGRLSAEAPASPPGAGGKQEG